MGLQSSSASGPGQTSIVKRSSYESGLRPFSPKPRLFNIRYYYYAILFVVFDVETVLLFPWAIKYGSLIERVWLDRFLRSFGLLGGSHSGLSIRMAKRRS